MRKMIKKIVYIPAPIDDVPQNCYSVITMRLLELNINESVFFPNKTTGQLGGYIYRIKRYKSYKYHRNIKELNGEKGVLVTRYE